MATIVNARDIILQAASPRILPVSLPSNITSIPSTVTVTGYGTLGGIANDSANALSQVSNKLNKSSSDVLSGAISVTTSGGFKAGTITWNSVGTVTGGSGVAMTAKGIVGASSGTPTFSIDINGNAYYYGTVSANQLSGGTVTASSVNTSGYIRSYGAYPTGVVVDGVTNYPSIYGLSASSSSGYAGVIGEGTGSASGVVGVSPSAAGVVGVTGTGIGVNAISYGSGTELNVFGKMQISSDILVTNLNADKLDGYHASNSSGQIPINNGTLCSNLNSDLLDGYHSSAFSFSNHLHPGTYVQVASGRSSGDYVYAVDFSSPSNPSTRAGWVRLTTNSGGGGVWVPYYT